MREMSNSKEPGRKRPGFFVFKRATHRLRQGEKSEKNPGTKAGG